MTEHHRRQSTARLALADAFSMITCQYINTLAHLHANRRRENSNEERSVRQLNSAHQQRQQQQCNFECRCFAGRVRADN